MGVEKGLHVPKGNQWCRSVLKKQRVYFRRVSFLRPPFSFVNARDDAGRGFDGTRMTRPPPRARRSLCNPCVRTNAGVWYSLVDVMI